MPEKIQRMLIALIVAAAVVGAVRDWRDDRPSVSAHYYEQTETAGAVEAAYTAPGPYEVAYEEHPAQNPLVGRHEIWYPAALEEEAGREWPIVVMANGTGVPASRYIPVFRHLASWGFVVIGNEQQNAWSGEASEDSLELLLQLNEDPDSVFYHKLDTDNVGSAGHSQGAIGALNAVTEQPGGSRYRALYLASCPSSRYADALGWAYDPARIAVPCLLVAGTGLLDAGDPGAPEELMSPEVAQDAEEISIAPLWSQEEIYRLIPEEVPKARARRTGADHAEMLPWPDGYMTAWFRYWLMGDEAAGAAFLGPQAELAANPLWQDVEKNL